MRTDFYLKWVHTGQIFRYHILLSKRIFIRGISYLNNQVNKMVHSYGCHSLGHCVLSLRLRDKAVMTAGMEMMCELNMDLHLPRLVWL